MFATYGVMDKLDVSVAIPFQRVSIDANVTSQLVRFGPNSGIAGSAIAAAQASKSGEAQGVGDVAVRAKYNIVNTGWGAIAAGIDQRLPTGREAIRLERGDRAPRCMPRSTSDAARDPHANVGYTFKSEENLDDEYFFGPEFSYAAGAEYVLHSRITLIGDVVGRSLADEGRLQQQTKSFVLSAVGSNPVIPEQPREVTQLTRVDGLRLNSALVIAGAKVNLASTFIVSAHVLFPATKGGVKSSPDAGRGRGLLVLTGRSHVVNGRRGADIAACRQIPQGPGPSHDAPSFSAPLAQPRCWQGLVGFLAARRHGLRDRAWDPGRTDRRGCGPESAVWSRS